ncbi:MAG TPA: hypothetical protein VFF19_32870 [Reyranella sp.]|nr:hypothetical protein [Reyranella sp.]
MTDMLPRKAAPGNMPNGTPAAPEIAPPNAGSVDRELAAAGPIAAQRLFDDAESAEVRIRPFVDDDKLALAAEGAGRTVVLE